MWVVFDSDTGEEIDRIEEYNDALQLIRDLNRNADYDHFAKRWEE